MALFDKHAVDIANGRTIAGAHRSSTADARGVGRTVVADPRLFDRVVGDGSADRAGR
ncbi:hypothetical protein NONO_c50220 [Nocardia nova SH22a]|uniref:Uncharacterized protein n=1 Tax=Nocardia nova SH22a TaxID=1415166 RepID=W5TRD4_9NOCA|nr:hypothetical protein [Nocardia nova]AHH19806.1 hypothetical protein NONO_c50220 [Nocardia nova SH22a]